MNVILLDFIGRKVSVITMKQFFWYVHVLHDEATADQPLEKSLRTSVRAVAVAVVVAVTIC